MRQFWKTFKRYSPWLFLLLAVDVFSALILWISSIQAFEALIGIIVLAGLVLFSVILFVCYFKEQHKQAVFQDFLREPDAVNTEKLLSAVSRQERD